MGTSGGLVYFSILKNNLILRGKLDVKFQLEKAFEIIELNFFIRQERALSDLSDSDLIQT